LKSQKFFNILEKNFFMYLAATRKKKGEEKCFV